MKDHQDTMRATWFGAVGLAGLFTFFPGRILNQSAFGEASMAGLIVVGLGVVVLLWLRRTRARPFRKPVSRG